MKSSQHLKFLQEQKDILISQLKAENYETHQELIKTVQDLQSLQHKYNQLVDEKLIEQQDFQRMIDDLHDIICQLRQELEKSQLRIIDQQAQITDMKEENRQQQTQVSKQKQQLHEQLEAEHCENINLKKQINILDQQNQYLQNDLGELQQANKQIMFELGNINQQYQTLLQNDQDTIKNMKREKEDLDQAFTSNKNQIERLQKDLISYRNEQLQAQQYIAQLQMDLEEINSRNDQLQSELESLLNEKGLYQNEINKNYIDQQKLEHRIKDMNEQLQNQSYEYNLLRNNHQAALEELEAINQEYTVSWQLNQELFKQIEQLEINEKLTYQNRLGQFRNIKGRIAGNSPPKQL